MARIGPRRSPIFGVASISMGGDTSILHAVSADTREWPLANSRTARQHAELDCASDVDVADREVTHPVER